MESFTQRWMPAFNGIIILVTILGLAINFLVLIVFYQRPNLRKVSNRMILSLIISNLLTCGFVAPWRIIWNFIGEQVHSIWECQALGLLTSMAVLSGSFSILAIGIDRYCAVTCPLHYSIRITRKRSTIMISSSWIVSFCLSIVPLFVTLVSNSQVKNQDDRERILQCDSSRMSLWRGAPVFLAWYISAIFFIGFCVPLISLIAIYVIMYKAAHQNNSRARKNSSSIGMGDLFGLTSKQFNPKLDLSVNNIPAAATFSKMMVNNKQASSGWANFFFKEEIKALTTTFLVIGSYLICWLPFFIIEVCEIGFYTVSVPVSVRLMAMVFQFSGSIVSPLIYVFRNKSMQLETKRVALFWKRSSFEKRTYLPNYSCGSIFSETIIVKRSFVSNFSVPDLKKYENVWQKRSQSEAATHAFSAVESKNEHKGNSITLIVTSDRSLCNRVNEVSSAQQGKRYNIYASVSSSESDMVNMKLDGQGKNVENLLFPGGAIGTGRTMISDSVTSSGKEATNFPKGKKKRKLIRQFSVLEYLDDINVELPSGAKETEKAKATPVKSRHGKNTYHILENEASLEKESDDENNNSGEKKTQGFFAASPLISNLCTACHKGNARTGQSAGRDRFCCRCDFLNVDAECSPVPITYPIIQIHHVEDEVAVEDTSRRKINSPELLAPVRTVLAISLPDKLESIMSSDDISASYCQNPPAKTAARPYFSLNLNIARKENYDQQSTLTNSGQIATPTLNPDMYNGH